MDDPEDTSRAKCNFGGIPIPVGVYELRITLHVLRNKQTVHNLWGNFGGSKDCDLHGFSTHNHEDYTHNIFTRSAKSLGDFDAFCDTLAHELWHCLEYELKWDRKRQKPKRWKR
jgi:hypothetical protein